MWRTERIARKWYLMKLAENLVGNVDLQYSNLIAVCFLGKE